MKPTVENPSCPFFEGKDRRCARRFNLQCIDEVYEQCLGKFHECAIFQDLTVGQSDRASEDVRAA